MSFSVTYAQAPTEDREGIRSAGVTGSCELPDKDARTKRRMS